MIRKQRLIRLYFSYSEMIRVGIDEAGRGPLAGPIRVGAAVILDETIDVTPFDDSKRLTEKRREIAYDLIQSYMAEGKLLVTSGYSRASTIDRLGIIPAQAQAMRRCVQKLLCHPGLDQGSLGLIEDSVSSAEWHCEILIDGNHTFGLGRLFSPSGGGRLRGRSCEVKTIIGGDGLIPEISIASIVAKVERDRYMTRRAKQLPQYGFDKHKGYGTKQHREMITQHGLSKIHRVSFCGNLTTT